MKKLINIFILFFSILLISCNKSDNKVSNTKLNNHELTEYLFTVLPDSTIYFSDKDPIIIKEKCEAKLNENNFAYDLNSNDIILEIKLINGKKKGIIGSININDLEFNSDIIYYLNKDFLCSERFINYIKNNRAINWDLSEIINNLSEYNTHKIIKELDYSEQKRVIDMINYCKRNDYPNIDYLNCKYLFWVIDYKLIDLNKIDINLLNKKMGPDENTLLIYSIKMDKSEISKKLISLGADINIQDKYGKSAVNYINENNTDYFINIENIEFNHLLFQKYVDNWEEYFTDEHYQYDCFFFDGYSDFGCEEFEKYKEYKRPDVEQFIKNSNIEKFHQENKGKYSTLHPYLVDDFGNYAYVNSKTYIVDADGNTIDVYPGDKVRILYTYSLENPNGDDKSTTSKYMLSPFVLVSDKLGRQGVISSYELCHVKSNVINDGINKVYLLGTIFKASASYYKSKDPSKKEGETVIANIYLVTEGIEKTSRLVHNIYSIDIYENVEAPIELGKAGNKYYMIARTKDLVDENSTYERVETFYITDNVLLEYGKFELINESKEKAFDDIYVESDGKHITLKDKRSGNFEIFEYDDEFNLIKHEFENLQEDIIK